MVIKINVTIKILETKKKLNNSKNSAFSGLLLLNLARLIPRFKVSRGIPKLTILFPVKKTPKSSGVRCNAISLITNMPKSAPIICEK
jgi:hypothetical protein